MATVEGALFGFAMGFVGSMPLTGPIAILVFQRGLFGKYRDGMAVAVGAALAEAAYCGLAVAGFGALLESYSFLRPFSRGLSVLILLGLGIWFLRTALPQEISPVSVRERGVGTLLRSFGQGFSITALNPIIVLNWSASIAILYSVVALQLTAPGKVLFVVAAAAGIVAWFAAMLGLLRKFEGRVPAQLFRVLIRGMGAALVVFGLWLGWEVVSSLTA